MSRLALVALLALAACAPGRGDSGSDTVRIGFLDSPSFADDLVLQGVEMAIGEARQAGSLVGRSIALRIATASDPRDAERAARRLRREGAVAIVAADDIVCRALAGVADRVDIVFLNAGCRADALRRADHRNTFHIEASDSMYRDAASPGAGAAHGLWHAGLTRFGAAQLNERFEKHLRGQPSSGTWAGWMAVKVVWETALRTGRLDARVLAGSLLHPEQPGFDGHKGEALAFDGVHQLRQPLYTVAGSLEHADEGLDASDRLDSAGQAGGSGTPRIRLDVPLLFVSNEGSASISVIDLERRRMVATIPVGSRPRGIHVAPDGRSVLVALSDEASTTESDRDAVAVIDLDRLGVTARHPVGTDPEQFAISPDGRTLFASNEDAGTVSVTDLSSGRVLATLLVGVEPEGVAASPDGRWVYVTAETSNTVSVIDTRARQVVASFLVGVRPRAATFSPDGERAWVTNEISATVSVVDAREHRVIGRIELADRAAKPVGVAVSPDSRRVYVANGHANSLAVLDAASFEVHATVPVGRRPWGIVIDPLGRYAYTANGGSDDVSVVDLDALRVVATIPVGRRPWGLALRP